MAATALYGNTLFILQKHCFQQMLPGFRAEQGRQNVANRLLAQRILIGVYQKIRLHQNLVIHLLNIAVSMMMAYQPAHTVYKRLRITERL